LERPAEAVGEFGGMGEEVSEAQGKRREAQSVQEKVRETRHFLRIQGNRWICGANRIRNSRRVG